MSRKNIAQKVKIILQIVTAKKTCPFFIKKRLTIYKLMLKFTCGFLPHNITKE